MRKLILLSALLTGLVLTGCKSDGDVEGAGRRTSAGSGVSTGGAGQGQIGSGTALGQDALSRRVVYFDYDSSELKPEGQSVVAAWATYLSQNPSAKVRLEGHTDERGTREYNIALGERRSRSVQQALQLRGVTGGQTSPISFGEERPVDSGHDESAWAQNRRVEIVQQ